MKEQLAKFGDWLKEIITSHPYVSIAFVVVLGLIALSIIFTGQLPLITGLFGGN